MDHRICFIGDSMTQGTCDPDYLGWPGRVAQAARAAGVALSSYNLGVRRDTSEEMVHRWQAECAARLKDGNRYYAVFCMGANDTTLESNSLRVPTNKTISNFSAMLKQAKLDYQVAAIGPIPVGDPEQDDRIDNLCDLLKVKAAEIDVPYLPVSRQIRASQVWAASIAEQDGCHPGAEGYQFLADLILDWDAWFFKK